MDRQELVETLQALDAELSSPLELVLVGGAAMILHYGARRATRDVDVLVIRGEPSELRRAAASVAEKTELPADWINDAVKGFADILPRDFDERLILMDIPLNNLRAYVLGRPEQAAMKIVALREQDLEDLDLLLPNMTKSDKETMVEIMNHVATFRIDWAQKIRYFLLEQGWEIE
jgi:hypothetical protein